MASKGITRSGEAYCLSCHQMVERDATKCEGCLSELTEEVKAFACPKCRTVIALGEPVCPTCGLKFKVRAVKAKEPAKDDQYLMKLIEWGRSPEEEGVATATAAQPAKEGAPVTQESTEQIRRLASLKSNISDLMANRSEMLERMEQRIEREKVRLAEIADAEDSSKAAEQVEAEIMALADEMADITMLQAHMDSLSDEISKLLESVDVSPPTRERGLAARALRKRLDAKEKEVAELMAREQQLVSREEMVNRKIQAYAQKKKQLDESEEELKTRLQKLEAERAELERLRAEAVGARTESERQEARAEWQEEQRALAKKLMSIKSTIAMHRTGGEPTPEEVASAEVDLSAMMSHIEEQISALIMEKIEIQTKMQEASMVDDDLKKLLKVLDQMLGQLPEEAIDRFSKSDDFKLYERVLDRFRI